MPVDHQDEMEGSLEDGEVLEEDTEEASPCCGWKIKYGFCTRCKEHC